MIILQEIIILGLGPGSLALVTQGALETMKTVPVIYLRTEKHPVVPALQAQGIKFASFDWVYEKGANFNQVYQQICSEIIALAQSSQGPLVYGVPGHPLVGESTVPAILEQAKELGIAVKIVPGMSSLDAIYSLLCLDPAGGIKIIDALSLDQQRPDPQMGNILLQVYNRFVASDVKLSLMEIYPDDYLVKVVRAAGIEGEEKVVEVPLYQLDRLDFIDHLVSVYLPPDLGQASSRTFVKLLDIMATLRGDKGCHWDKEQDHLTLRPYLLEETYEVLETIEDGEMHKLCEELGDLLLQIVFHAQIAKENGCFEMADVLQSINEKMIRRHPHVFADVQVANSAQVLDNWEKIKAMEKKDEKKASILDGVPKHLPALMLAYKIQQKAAKVGFDWEKAEAAWLKVQEELAEVGEALGKGEKTEIEEELGDLLFALVNVCRLLNLYPEVLLHQTVEKFKKRFFYIEQEARRRNLNLAEMSLQEMDILWEMAKKS